MHGDSTALTVRDSEVLEPGEKTLEELADTANHEHQQVLVNIERALGHALLVGEALKEARDIIHWRGGSWPEWLKENFRGEQSNANGYIRLATYKDHLPPEAFQPYIRKSDGTAWPPSVSRALTYLRALPKSHPSGPKRASGAERAEIKRLRQSGLSYRAISDLGFGSRNKLRRICDPDYSREDSRRAVERRKKKKLAEQALQEKLQRRTLRGRMEAEGGAVEKTWNLIRQALDEAQRAYDQAAGDRDKRRVIANTITALHQAEAEIVKAPEVPS